MAATGRGHHYRKARARLLASEPVCVWCRERPATQADHVPALSEAPSPELWVGQLVPACRRCNSQRAARMTNRRRSRPRTSRDWWCAAVRRPP